MKLYGDDKLEAADQVHQRARYAGAIKRRISGRPDMEQVTTSHVERQNLTMRMGMRRFTRKTNAFSKKLENHMHMLSLYFVHYNFIRIHKSLRASPAMDAGLANELYDMNWILELIDDRTTKPGPRGTYKNTVGLNTCFYIDK